MKNPTAKTARRWRTLVCLLALAGVIAGARDAMAVRGKIPVLIQVTHNSGGAISPPALRSERAETIVFTSDGDVMGAGSAPGHREVYIWDTATRLTTRVTDSGTGESYAPARATDNTGTWRDEFVVFISTADLDASVGNSDGNPELFLWEMHTGVFKQLTNTQPPVVNGEPYASDSGKCIVFSSTGDLDDNIGLQTGHPATGNTNVDGSKEVFLFFLDDDNRTLGGSMTQLSSGPAGTSSWAPTVGDYYFPRQCQQTVFVSDYDQIGNGSTGNHIYRFKRGSGELDQMTIHPRESSRGLPVDGDFDGATLSSASRFATGPYIIYAADADVLNTGNASFNIFKYRIQHPRSSQITALTAPFFANSPVVSDGGQWVAFESNGELIDPRRRVHGAGTAPFNADGNTEIFRTRMKRGAVQITHSENCENTAPSIRDNGTSIAFRSTCDLVPGHNPDGIPQVFFYTQVKSTDPLATAAGCKIADGCCNEATGCYLRIDGRLVRPPKQNCLARPISCR